MSCWKTEHSQTGSARPQLLHTRAFKGICYIRSYALVVFPDQTLTKMLDFCMPGSQNSKKLRTSGILRAVANGKD